MKFLRKLFSLEKLFAGIFVFAVMQFLDPTVVFAVTSQTNNSNEVLQQFASLLSVVIKVLTFFTMMFINYAGDLMGTKFLIGETPLATITSMWVIVRNITNISFIIILLFLVFSNMFSFGDGGGWTIKDKLPKVIISLIAINFSLLAFRVAIDAVNVGTTMVLSIPQAVLEHRDKGGIKELMMQGVQKSDAAHCDDLSDPKGIVLDNEITLGNKDNEIKIKKQHNGTEDCAPFYSKLNSTLCKHVDDATKAGKDNDCLFYLDPNKFEKLPEAKSTSSHNLMMAFGVFFVRIEQLPQLAANLNSWDGVVTNILFSGILTLAFFVALIAIFIALLVRVVALWVFMVFSPLLMASSIMGLGSGEGGDLTGKMVTYLIMPLKIAAAFGVTFIMISAMTGPASNLDPQDFMKLGPALSHFGDGINGILWQIATIGIFWETAFWAVKGTAAETIINKVKDTAQNLGKMGARAATVDRQVFKIPVQGGKAEAKMSLGMLGQLPEKLTRVMEQRAREDSTTEFNKIFNPTGANVDKITNAISNAKKEDISNEMYKGVQGLDMTAINAMGKEMSEAIRASMKKEGLKLNTVQESQLGRWENKVATEADIEGLGKSIETFTGSRGNKDWGNVVKGGKNELNNTTQTVNIIINKGANNEKTLGLTTSNLYTELKANQANIGDDEWKQIMTEFKGKVIKNASGAEHTVDKLADLKTFISQ